MLGVTRRALVAGSALALGAASMAASTRAASPPVGRQAPGFYRYRIGTYELTAISDGVWHVPIDEAFVRNAALADVRQAMADAFMPDVDNLPLPFTTLLINTGTKLILVDTGTGGQIAPTAGTQQSNLAAAGLDPTMVDAVVISHFHPDHINGITTKDNDLIFPNAEIMVPESEWSFWMDDANLRSAPSDVVKGYFLNARRVFGHLGKNVTRFKAGKELAPGMVSIAAPGHTPGHVAFAIASGKEAMLLLSDVSTHPALFLRHPDWEVVFDLNGPQAAETRKRLLDRVTADRMLVAGYHFPFPACGHVVKDGSGYALVPVQWQPQL